jgi:AcrR family transcriptional regulator
VPKQERSREAVRAIMSAAEEYFVTYGYDRASVSRIADRAGVSIGSIYQFFPDKEALLVELAHRSFQAHAGVLETQIVAGRGLSSKDAIRYGLSSYFASLADKHALKRNIFMHMSASQSARTDTSHAQRYHHSLRGFLSSHCGAKMEEADTRAFIILHGMGGILDEAAQTPSNLCASKTFVTHQIDWISRVALRL